MRFIRFGAIIVFTLALCGWVSFNGGWTVVCGAIAPALGWTLDTCEWPQAHERLAVFGVLTQMFGTLAAAAIAALAAGEASRQTIRQYEKQDIGRLKERRAAIAQMLAAELAIVPRPLKQLFKTGTKLVPVTVKDEEDGTEKTHTHLQFPSDRLKGLLPHIAVYDGLVGELGLLKADTTLAVCQLFAQVRRVRIEPDLEHQFVTLFPANIGFLVVHLMDALHLLARDLSESSQPTQPLSDDVTKALRELSQTSLELHTTLLSAGNPIGLGVQFPQTIGRLTAHWANTSGKE